VHINNGITLKKVFKTKEDGVRIDGRPKLQWNYSVDQDMRILELEEGRPQQI
jgi:hypothetical protein